MTLDDGEQVPVELALDEESLTLRTGGNLIGAWPVKYCRVSRSGRGAFLLSIDGEKVVFEPQALEEFAKTAAHRFRASTLADRIAVVRDLPTIESNQSRRARSPESEDRKDRPTVAGFLSGLGIPQWVIPAVTAVAVVLVVWSLISQDSEGDLPEFLGTSITVPSTAVPAPFIFDMDVEDFTSEWNLAASTFGVPLQIRGVLTPGQFESQIAPSVSLQGRTDADGTIASVVVVIDPNGETDDDQLALRTLNLIAAVASPQLDASGRAGLIEDLGLDVRNPQLAGLDGVEQVDGVEYSLSYIDEFQSLLFTVNEA